MKLHYWDQNNIFSWSSSLGNLLPPTNEVAGRLCFHLCVSVSLSVYSRGCSLYRAQPCSPSSKGPWPSPCRHVHICSTWSHCTGSPPPHMFRLLNYGMRTVNKWLIGILLKSFLDSYAFEPYLFLLNGEFTICNSDLWVLFPNQCKMFIIWKHQRINYNRKVQMIKDV